MKHTRGDLQECFSPFLSPQVLYGAGTVRVTVADQRPPQSTEVWLLVRLTACLSVRLFWLASGSSVRSWSLKWLECFLSVFSVEGSAEKCGFSRPLWLYNMYQPFPAAATAAEAGALKTDFMCGLCHPCRQMDGAFRKGGSSFYTLQVAHDKLCWIEVIDFYQISI